MRGVWVKFAWKQRTGLQRVTCGRLGVARAGGLAAATSKRQARRPCRAGHHRRATTGGPVPRQCELALVPQGPLDRVCVCARNLVDQAKGPHSHGILERNALRQMLPVQPLTATNGSIQHEHLGKCSHDVPRTAACVQYCSSRAKHSTPACGVSSRGPPAARSWSPASAARVLAASAQRRTGSCLRLPAHTARRQTRI